MRRRLLTIVVATSCLTVAAAARAAAQGSGDEWRFGALYDPVFHVLSETSSVGVHFDVSKTVVMKSGWNPTVTLRVQLDFRRVFFESDSESATRLGVGLVIPFRTK